MKRGRKPGSPNIDDRVRIVVAEYAIQFPKEKREPLAHRLRAVIERMGYPVPEPQTLIKMITAMRKAHFEKNSDMDKPWQVASLEQYPIRAEDVQAVLQASQLCREEGRELSVREAQWVARLHSLFSDIRTVIQYSRKYALGRQAADASGVPYDSSALDQDLAQAQEAARQMNIHLQEETQKAMNGGKKK